MKYQIKKIESIKMKIYKSVYDYLESLQLNLYFEFRLVKEKDTEYIDNIEVINYLNSKYKTLFKIKAEKIESKWVPIKREIIIPGEKLNEFSYFYICMTVNNNIILHPEYTKLWVLSGGDLVFHWN